MIHYWNDNSKDNSPSQAIGTARRYALGLATLEEMRAAGDAAAASARGVTWLAAEEAAWAAAETAQRFSPWFAVRSASWAAAEDAYSEEISWQRSRLIDYLTGLSALPPSET